jgi:hypothetical protein
MEGSVQDISTASPGYRMISAASEPAYTAVAQVHIETQIYNAIGDMPAGSLATRRPSGPRH